MPRPRARREVLPGAGASRTSAYVGNETDKDHHTVLGEFVATKAGRDVCEWDVKVHSARNMKIGVARPGVTLTD